MSLDEGARAGVEYTVDMIIKEPKEFENQFSDVLRQQGIEPNLETVLSFFTGMMYGFVVSYYSAKFNRSSLTQEERSGLIELLKRRAFEIRQAVVSTRIES